MRCPAPDRRRRSLRHSDLHGDRRRPRHARWAGRLRRRALRTFFAAHWSASRICSNDPVCADHEPDDRSGDRATHGAACHGCLLIAETSCEMRNLFLDRNLLVPTMSPRKSAFFCVES